MTLPTDPDRTVDDVPRQDSAADGPGAPQPEAVTPARLELLEEIARGGMGAVLKARDVDFGRDVAVKVLREDHQDRTDLLNRFFEEARISGRLQHPGVVPVYALGRLPDGRAYFSMKLVTGRTLAALLAERPDPSVDRPRFLAVFEQVCQTVAYAHSKGVLHRDLKPANIMVGGFGEVQVMDWGLAKVLPQQEDGGGRQEGTNTERSADSPALPSSTFQETHAGSVLGTPAYMAPEQARGEIDQVDERADVFGLGAILCEILTGQPPFAGAQALLRAQQADLADAFDRLDGCGADPELIALGKRCLAAEPADRPSHAGETAAAVTAYRESVERRLRLSEVANAEAKAKAAEERKRRRLRWLLVGSLLLTAALAGGGWFWYAQDRAGRQAEADRLAADRLARAEGAADVALAKAEQAAEQARASERAADERGGEEPETPGAAGQALASWRQALQGLDEAGRALEGAAGADEARGRLTVRRQEVEAGLRRAEKEARLLTDLDGARALHRTSGGSGFDYKSAAQSYATALERYGLTEAAERQAAAIRQERPAIRLALVMALDDWAGCVGGPEAARLRGVADGADDDAWRPRCRAATAAGDLGRMKRLAEEARGLELPAVSADLLARDLGQRGARAEAAVLLRQTRRQHPADFWVHFDLGWCLHDPLHPDPATLDEAAGCCWTAIALRSDSAPAHVNLGTVLYDQGDKAGAAACYQKAVELDPTFAMTHVNLGLLLYDQGDKVGAAACYLKAIDLDPKLAMAHNNLGVVLNSQGDQAGAAACYQKAIDLDPRYSPAYANLGNVLQKQQKLDRAAACYRQAIALEFKYAPTHCDLGFVLYDQGDRAGAAACFKKTIELDPNYAKAQIGLAHLLYDQGDRDGAAACCEKAIKLDPNFALAYYNLGRVRYSQGNQAQAAVYYRKAIKLDPKYAPAHNNLGSLLYARGDLDGAAACYLKAVEADPKDAAAHYNLGSVLLNLGHFAESKEHFQRSLGLFSSNEPRRARAADHVRHCDRLLVLEAKVGPVLKGEKQPDDDERLGLAEVCMYQRRYAAAARFCRDAFAQDPKLADDLEYGDRHNAACAAAKAGCGQGEDARELDAKERAAWRQQGLAWLRADLTLWEKRLASDKTNDQTLAVQVLQGWQHDTALSGLRDAAELAKLPADEQEACRKLWADVQALLDRTDLTR